MAARGGEPQSLASLQATTFLKHLPVILGQGVPECEFLSPQGLVGFWLILGKCEPRVGKQEAQEFLCRA